MTHRQAALAGVVEPTELLSLGNLLFPFCRASSSSYVNIRGADLQKEKVSQRDRARPKA